jgi:hypothetical protein
VHPSARAGARARVITRAPTSTLACPSAPVPCRCPCLSLAVPSPVGGTSSEPTATDAVGWRPGPSRT